MSIHGQSTHSNSSGPQQSNPVSHPPQYQPNSDAALAYPYNYPSRRPEGARLENGAGPSHTQHDPRLIPPRHPNVEGEAGGVYRHPARIDTPQDGGTHAASAQNRDSTRPASTQNRSAIHPNMRIPPEVDDSEGSICELASKMTCLFWFESVRTLRKADAWTPLSSPIQRLVRDAIPTSPFRKWVVLILTTTQVAPSVIMLALLFIYRLKTLNPTVKGKAGSEYRLLTVALMLGNKFLDDNTYTNQTWAEVSGISVGEIHVMEVEFLSNVRYSLMATRQEWDAWRKQLGRFLRYFDMAASLPIPSPGGVFHGYLPPPANGLMPVASHLLQANHQSTDLIKKRSYEDMGLEPAAKRTATVANRQVPGNLHPNLPLRNIPRLPVPGLSISTNANPNTNYAGFHQSLPPLPPMNGRAMAQVFPSTPSWTPPQASMQHSMSLPPIGPSALGYNPSTPGLTSSFSTSAAGYSLPSSQHGTPSRRHSPRSIGVHSMNSSPITGSFPVQDLNSPSIFLQQRNSPYKPLRPPNTLLHPPPGIFQGYSQHHQPGIEQMHYQPLGKRNEYRSGVVPEYQNSTNANAGYYQVQDHDMAPGHHSAR